MSNNSSGGEVDQRPSLLPGDAERGRRIFEARGAQCHAVSNDPSRFVFHSLGPNLYGVMGSAVATADGPNERNHQRGYPYSQASLKAQAHMVWTRDTMERFLENPRKFMPGTSMAFVGLKKPQERADVIAYLETLR